MNSRVTGERTRELEDEAKEWDELTEWQSSMKGPWVKGWPDRGKVGE